MENLQTYVGFWGFIVQMDPSSNPSDRKGLGWPDGAKDGRGPSNLDGTPKPHK
jgi:hypothetical protein